MSFPITSAVRKFFWQQTTLRIKDPKVSVKFYQDNFGMKLVHTVKHEKHSQYFLANLPDDISIPSEPSAAEKFLYSTNVTTLELLHNHGNETNDSLTFHSGNTEPHRGFGHICFLLEGDLEEACQKLEDNGVSFKKKPSEGRMKTLAFALDPDGIWIELISRNEGVKLPGNYNLAQTMIRVKDPKKSLAFYEKLGLVVLAEKKFSDFSLYFLGNSEDDGSKPDRELNSRFHPILELTHNHGTESDDSFSYYAGKDDDQNTFASIGFVVDNLKDAATTLSLADVGDTNVISTTDPDGYHVKFIQRT